MLYMPALHKGYLDFFKAHPNVRTVYVLGQEILDTVDYLRKDLRALTPAQQVSTLNGLSKFDDVKLLTLTVLAKLDGADTELIMPDDDVSHQLADGLKKAKVNFYPVFLRWDRRAVNANDPVNPDRTISSKAFDKEVMQLATKESGKSSNIWRRVGAAIVKDGKVISKSSNRQQPTDFSLWIDGDPRGTLRKGADVETTTDMHAEAKLIANAAKYGYSLKGASIYVTNFPCPPCSKLIAESGMAKCYYSAGYALLDGEELLKSCGVELIHVGVPEESGHPAEWVTYKKPNS